MKINIIDSVDNAIYKLYSCADMSYSYNTILAKIIMCFNQIVCFWGFTISYVFLQYNNNDKNGKLLIQD